MNFEQASLVISALALLATIIGWRYTYVKQKAILTQTREYSVRDREIQVLRERLKIITEITNTLHLIGFGYSGRLRLYTDGILTTSSEQLPEEMKKFMRLISSPDYLYLDNLLDEEAQTRIANIVELLTEGISTFGDLREEWETLQSKNQDEYPSEDAVVAKREEFSEYVSDLALSFYMAAGGFSSEFTALERKIVAEKYSLEAE